MLKNSVIARGVDTIIVGYSMDGQLDPGIVDTLDNSKELAQDPDAGAGEFPVPLYHLLFSILPKGYNGYDWILRNDDVSIAISRHWNKGIHRPEIMVTFRSSFLWREGLDICTQIVFNFLNLLGDIIDTKISRVDIATDIKEPVPDVSLTDKSIQGRMRNKSNYVGSVKAIGLKHTGYQLGTGDIVARVYDKIHEINVSKKDWMKTVWARNNWLEDEPVTRVEFQFRRNALKDFNINSIKSLIDTLPDLWHYATCKWFTMRNRNPLDSNHRRWALSEFWLIVQSTCFLFGERLGILRYHQRKLHIDHLESMIKGCLITITAMLLSHKKDLDSIKDSLSSELNSIFQEDPDFDARAISRQSKFSYLS